MQVTTAREAVESARLVLDTTKVHQAVEYVTAQSGLDPTPSWVAGVATLLIDAQVIAEETATKRPVTKPTISAIATPFVGTIEALHSTAAANATKIADDKTNAGTLLLVKQQELAELTARLDLNRHLVTAHAYVERASEPSDWRSCRRTSRTALPSN